jgi:tRNA dimethylallyltransferase
MPAKDHPVVVVAGPTASGKSRLGMALAKKYRGEIIGCDALQIYRGMDIGTAKPAPAERESVPHHMLDLRMPGEDFSAGEYQRLGREALRAIRDRGRIAFVVGGTGFYLRALIQGLFQGPGRSEELRRRFRRIAERRGVACLYRALQRADPATAARIAPTDISRIIRAYEVYLLTGRPMNWWHCQPRSGLEGFRWLKLGIQWPRGELYCRIETRVEEMFQAGFVAEVRGLLERFPGERHAFKAIGYRQIAGFLAGKITLDQAQEQTKMESRRYAKRQMTWFCGDPEIAWLDASQGEEQLLARAVERIDAFLRSDE